MDNLNTHRMATLYETFPAAEARRIAKRLEFPTPQAWQLPESCPELAEGMAETEFSVLARARLKGRNPDECALKRNFSACGAKRNAMGATINWRFTA